MKSIASITVVLLAPTLLTLSGCSNQQAYDSLQGARQNECNKIVDNNARLRCFDEANKNYESYRKEHEAALAK